MDWAGASWYSLPWYFLLPMGASVVLLALSMRLACRPGRSVFSRLIRVHFWYAVLAIGAYAQFIEPYRIEVTHERFLFPGAPAIRIVHLSDIQCEYLTRREKDAAEIISGLRPDLVVLTGDYYTGTREHQQEGFRAARK